MKIVFLDYKTLGCDKDLEMFEEFGEVIKYPFTEDDKVLERVKDGDIIVTNKVKINRDTVGEKGNIKLVCVAATGTDNIDKEYLDENMIEWRNVAGYSTSSVAQHTFAMMFYLLENLPYYDNYVKSDKYSRSPIFTNFERPFMELSGKTLGIIGLGAIGRKVYKLGEAFGMNVIYCSMSNSEPQPGYKMVSYDELLKTSDIITIHAPLNKYTDGLIDKKALSKMKKTAILLNTGRGQIISEKDLADALLNGDIKAAGLDVLSKEPISKDNPLGKIKSDNLLITPHIAWASTDSRKRLLDTLYSQIKEFINN